MSTGADILRGMIDSADSDAEKIESSITSVEDQISDLQEKFDAIRDDMLDVGASDLKDYLENVKKPEIPEAYEVVYGPDYNVINITDWLILDATANTVYEYLGIGWDDSTAIIDYITEWDFGYDYLYHEMGFDGTYGIYPKINLLQQSKSMLEDNKTKVADSKTKLERYAT